jgi:hypothetical protein
MQATEDPNHTSLGIHLNSQTWPLTRNWPEWANRAQREKWKEKGLILWDDDARQVNRLSGRQALSLLDHLRTASEWKDQGCTVGEPAWRLSLDNPDDKAELVLWDTINLSPQQTQVLFDFLVREEKELQQMKAAEEEETKRILGEVYTILIRAGERGKHTIYDETLSWTENKRIMRHRWQSGEWPEKLTWTERELFNEVLEEINAEYEREKRRAQERVLRMKKNLLSHHFFWERVKPLWPYLKANERLHILQRLRDTEWNQDIMTEIRQIVENAQFFETITAKIGSTEDIDKITGDELDLLLDLHDDDLWNELLALYEQKPTVVRKE